MFDLPFDTKDVGVKLIDISALRVYFKYHTRLFDIGSLMYTDRKSEIKPRGRRPDSIPSSLFFVNADSYIESRKQPLERFVEHIFIEAKKDSSYTTLEYKIKLVIRFMLWCDSSGHESCLDNLDQAKYAFRAYVNELEHKIKIHDPDKEVGLSNRTAVAYQNYIKRFLAIALNIHVDSLVEGIRLLTINNYVQNHTLAPDHQILGKNLALWSCLFHNITDFLLTGKQYPFELPLPEETVWLLPSQNPFLTKCQKRIRKRMLFGFDHDDGRMLDGHEIKARFGHTTSAANQILKRSNEILNTANKDLRHTQRYRLGKIAHDAFFMIFMLHTRTRSDIRFIHWDDNTNIDGAESVGFKIIKARARGKVCEYQVSAKFIREFKRFLNLRKWMLNDQRFEYLFFRLDKNGIAKQTPESTPKEFSIKVVSGLIDANFPTITPSQCRVAAADHILNKYDISTAATMLQNKKSTLEKHYANGNHQRASKQFTNFFSKLRQRIISIDDKLPDHIEVPSGHCDQLNSPQAEPDATITVNCQTPQGCLYCEHFTVHADETDIRKLLSLEYIIRESKTLAHSIEHFESIYTGLLKRINALLHELSQLNKSSAVLVTTIRKEVYTEEKLSPYWDNKLRQLVSMGVL